MGLAFLVCLVLSYYMNRIFLEILDNLSQNPILLLLMIFINNVAVISLILLGMTFYVNLVISNFFEKEKYANVVIEHPRIFALFFAIIILFLSVLRGINFFLGVIMVELLPFFLLASSPILIIEGYGIFITITKTLSRAISIKDMIFIYGLFFIAATIEVSLMIFLVWWAHECMDSGFTGKGSLHLIEAETSQSLASWENLRDLYARMHFVNVQCEDEPASFWPLRLLKIRYANTMMQEDTIVMLSA